MLKTKPNHKFVKTFEEFSGIPQEGKKLRKRKPGDRIFLEPDTQNPTNPTDAASDPIHAKYPYGGV